MHEVDSQRRTVSQPGRLCIWLKLGRYINGMEAGRDVTSPPTSLIFPSILSLRPPTTIDHSAHTKPSLCLSFLPKNSQYLPLTNANAELAYHSNFVPCILLRCASRCCFSSKRITWSGAVSVFTYQVLTFSFF